MFEEGGVCLDMAHTFCKSFEYVKEKKPELIHTHAVPITIYPMNTGRSKGKAHSIVGVVQTDPPKIAFMAVTGSDSPAEDIDVKILPSAPE